MTEIDVPDWVVEAGVKAMQTVTHWESHEDFRQKVSQAVITAALGAWVVRAAKIGACAEVQWLQGGPCQLPPNEIIYTLRQEKPE